MKLKSLLGLNRLGKVKASIFQKRAINKSQTTTLDPQTLRAISFSNLLRLSPAGGVIVECGVGEGESLIMLSKLSSKCIYAFDSFQGFPDNGPNDSPNFNASERFMYKSTTQDFISTKLKLNGVSKSDLDGRIFTVKGFFENTLPSFSFEDKISFLHLDVDLYESYRICLRSLVGHLKPGAVILFDEYDDPSDVEIWPGAMLAINEFLEEYSLSINRTDTGKAYVVFPGLA